jgi:PAS domain S-box-containing protein
MNDKPIKVLLVEDSPAQALMMRGVLEKVEKPQIELSHAERLSTAFERLSQESPDVILLDLFLPDSKGLDSFTKLHARAPETPIVIVSWLEDEEVAVKTVQQGAQDYLVKGRVDGDLLVRSLRYAIGRKRAEQAMARLAAIVESSDDAILSVTTEGAVVSWNSAAERIYGYKAEEIIGRPISVIFPPDRAEEVRSLLEKLKWGRGFQNFEILCLKKNSKPFFASLTLSPMKDPDGEVRLISSIVRDVSERKMSEAKLQILAGELEQKNQELQQFVYVASHDLREPLRTMASYTQLLARRYKEKLDADANDFIGYVVNAAARMQALIDDLLTYSRLGRQTKSPVLTDFEAVLHEVVENLSTTIGESGAVVTHDPLPTLSAEATEMTQLYQNLIANALKFHGKDPPRVHISAQERQRPRDGNLGGPNSQPETEWLFSVRDNGIGIDPKNAGRIFMIFQRLHTQEEYPGTGIGLAICKKIVEQNGGRIWVESEPGKGTTFYFTIPKQKGSSDEQELLTGQP